MAYARLLLAAVFVFVGLLITYRWVTPLFPSVLPGVVVLIVFPLLLIAAMLIFMPRDGERKSRFRPRVSRRFTATRAFQVAEVDGEGPLYYLELTDGSVLYLGGQYLYEYEAIDDDLELNQPRRFPCTEFVVHRDAREGYAVEIECGGTVLEPETLARAFTEDEYERGLIPLDGAILTGTTYDEVREKMNADRRVQNEE